MSILWCHVILPHYHTKIHNSPILQEFTLALLKKGVNIKPNMMEEEPYKMNKRNRRKRLAFWNTLASGSRMIQTKDSSRTYMAYTVNHDNLHQSHQDIRSDSFAN